jgi:hypothetical protein
MDGVEQILASLDPARPFSDRSFRSAIHKPRRPLPIPSGITIGKTFLLYSSKQPTRDNCAVS